MKTIWQASDIQTGHYVIFAKNLRTPLDQVTDLGYLVTLVYQVGWVSNPGAPVHPDLNPPNRCLIALCDGMVMQPETEAGLAKTLTKGYIPLPFKHLIRVIEYLRETRA